MVTGASQGIGLGLACELRDRGATVIASARTDADLEKLRSLEKFDAALLELARDDSIVSFSKFIRSRHELVDVVFNNAGTVSSNRSIDGCDREELFRVFGVNVVGALLVTKSLLPALRVAAKRPRTLELSDSNWGCPTIVNIGSRLGSFGLFSGGSSYPYRISKAGLHMATRCLAHELAPEGILAFALHPGRVRTRITDDSAPLNIVQSATAILDSVEHSDMSWSGSLRNHEGSVLPW